MDDIHARFHRQVRSAQAAQRACSAGGCAASAREAARIKHTWMAPPHEEERRAKASSVFGYDFERGVAPPYAIDAIAWGAPGCGLTSGRMLDDRTRTSEDARGLPGPFDPFRLGFEPGAVFDARASRADGTAATSPQLIDGLARSWRTRPAALRSNAQASARRSTAVSTVPSDLAAKKSDFTDERDRYIAHELIGDLDKEFLDYVFWFIDLARILGIFEDYFRAQDRYSGGSGGDLVDPPETLLSTGWDIWYADYVAFFDGTDKPRVELVDGLKTITGSLLFGTGYKGKIQLNAGYIRCARRHFFGGGVRDDGWRSATRICAALDVAAVMVHEAVHLAGDWREAPAWSLEGFFRYELWNAISTLAPVELVVLAGAGLSERPTDWVVDACATRTWPCGTTWREWWGRGPCDLPGLKSDMHEWNDFTGGCGPTT